VGDILIVAEQREGQLQRPTRSALTFGAQMAETLGVDWHIVAVGHGLSGMADELASYGARSVLLVDHPALEGYLAETYAPCVVTAAKEVDATLIGAASTAFSRDLLPRVTALLDAGMVTEVLEVKVEDGQLRFSRPMHAGAAIAWVTVEAPIVVAAVRPANFPGAEPDTPGSEVRTLEPPPEALEPKAEFIAFEPHKSERPSLLEADVVVSGGRGVGGPEGFKLIEELADLLGAAVGASRPPADAGWVPTDWQVGQTGKTVTPNLYFAIGISGAVQHLSGMKDSKVIVAINKDPEAPIFSVATYGLVADLFEAVPQLIEEIKKLKSEA
jgi:electron transfer flavoprotein alpha subunit